MKRIIATLRSRFDAISLREKSLLVVFVWVMLILWLGWARDNLSQHWQLYQANQKTLESQEITLATQQAVNMALAETQERFDASRTRNSAELTGHIDFLMRQSGINVKNFRTVAQEGAAFNLYDMRVSIDRAELSEILAFEDKIRAEAPYINLQKITISADQSRPDRVDVTLEISSFELKDSISQL